MQFVSRITVIARMIADNYFEVLSCLIRFNPFFRMSIVRLAAPRRIDLHL